MKPKVVTVFGSSQPRPGSAAYELAHELGRGIAAAGWALCNGGYGGTMEAGAKGAVEAGGHTMGVTLSRVGPGGPNPHIRQEIPTFSLLVRLETLIRLGHGYVVLPGGTGTLLEFAAVWEMFNKRVLRRAAPLILLGEHWRPIVAAVRSEQPDAPEPYMADSVSAVLEVLSTHLAGTANDESAESAAG